MHIAVLVFGRLDKTNITYSNIKESFGQKHVFDFFYVF